MLETLRWLMMPTPPGDVESLEAILGRDAEGRACSLRVESTRTVLVAADGSEEVLQPQEVGARLLDGRFVPERVRVNRNATERLFRLAVAAAQKATEKEAAAYKLLEAPKFQTPAGDGVDLDWELIELLGHVSDTADAALQAIVFAVATAEAQINAWGNWDDESDRWSVEDKCRALAKRAGGRIDLGKGSGQWFMKAIAARHEIVHSKPGVVTRRITRVEKEPQAQRARRACVGVRSVLVDLARLLGDEPPRYLAMAPHDPDDVAAWLSALVLTGVRDDPDFEHLRTTRQRGEPSATN